MLQAQQAVDLEVPLVIERAQIAEHRGVDSGNGPPGAHRLGNARGDHVALVAPGQRQAEIGVHHPGLEEHARLRRRSADRADVKLVVHAPRNAGIVVNDRNAVAVLA